MDRATTISGLGHAGFILWVLLGDFLFSPDLPPPIEVASVSMISSDEFAAMEASAPKDEPPAEVPGEATPVETPTEAELPQEEAPPPEPVPEEPAPQDQTLPVEDVAQPDEAPVPTAPLAEQEQLVPVPETSIRPKPRKVDRVAAVPVEDTNDTPDIADEVVPEVSDQAETVTETVPEEQPPASPEEATTQIVTEATETEEDAPELAPTSSRRPQARREAPVEVAQDPAEDPVDPNAVDPATETADADAEAIAAALAEAASEPAAEEGGSVEGLPDGPPMSASQVEGLRVAINKCWNVGQLSSEAMRVTVTIRVQMLENGKPDAASIEMTGFEGGTDAAAQKAYEAGRRAVLRCAGEGYDLPPDQYNQWNVLNLVFDPSGMRLR